MWKTSKEIHFAANRYECIGKQGGDDMFGDLTMKNIKKEIKLGVNSERLYKTRGATKGFFFNGK
jgi:hypothetical protein